MMKRLLSWFKAILAAKPSKRAASSRNTQDLPPGGPHASAPDWTDDHAGMWEMFLRGPVGRDLLLRGKAVAAAVSARAVADQFHTSHSAGVAHGWNEAMTWLESLSRSSRVIDEVPAGPPREGQEANDTLSSKVRDELRELHAP